MIFRKIKLLFRQRHAKYTSSWCLHFLGSPTFHCVKKCFLCLFNISLNLTPSSLFKISIYLKVKVTKRTRDREKSFTCWIAFQMATKCWDGSGRSQEPGVFSKSLTWVDWLLGQSSTDFPRASAGSWIRSKQLRHKWAPFERSALYMVALLVMSQCPPLFTGLLRPWCNEAVYLWPQANKVWELMEKNFSISGKVEKTCQMIWTVWSARWCTFNWLHFTLWFLVGFTLLHYGTRESHKT